MIELRWIIKNRKPDTLAIAAGFGATHSETVLQYREWTSEVPENTAPCWFDVPVVEETCGTTGIAGRD